MTTSNLADILIAVALLCWVIYRQLTWRLVSSGALWRMPVIVAAIGVIMIAQMKDAKGITLLDVTVLIVELVVSFGLGALMGTMATFRSRPQRATDVRTRNGETAVWSSDTTVTESRTGGWGLVLWLVLIAIRIGIDLVASDLGATLATATGTILIVLAANRAARALVIGHRLEQHRLVNA
jgi:hypothetical protein